jgi:hypothetical protein
VVGLFPAGQNSEAALRKIKNGKGLSRFAGTQAVINEPFSLSRGRGGGEQAAKRNPS